MKCETEIDGMKLSVDGTPEEIAKILSAFFMAKKQPENKTAKKTAKPKRIKNKSNKKQTDYKPIFGKSLTEVVKGCFDSGMTNAETKGYVISFMKSKGYNGRYKKTKASIDATISKYREEIKHGRKKEE